MSAGLPGLGLGGLFFIVSALVAPIVELRRTVNGCSSVRAWRAVGRQFALAVAMIVAIDLTLRVAFIALAVTGLGNAPASDGVTVLPLTPIGITGAVVAMVLAGAKAMQLAVAYRAADLTLGMPSPPRRAVASAGAFAIAWLAVLTIGASELSNVPSGHAAEPAPRPDEASLNRADTSRPADSTRTRVRTRASAVR